MLEHSRSRIKILARHFCITLIASIVFSGMATAVDLNDQTSIVEAAAMDRAPADMSLAASLASQAAARADQDRKRLGRVDWAATSKLWCEAALIAPGPENLLECARARFCSTRQSSNPQPSREAAIMEQAQRSLTLIRAGLEIAGGQPDISSRLRSQLIAGANCLRIITNKKEDVSDCLAPYTD